MESSGFKIAKSKRGLPPVLKTKLFIRYSFENFILLSVNILAIFSSPLDFKQPQERVSPCIK